MSSSNQAAFSRRKKKFVEFYVESGQAVASAEKAGYSANRAERIAVELLKDPMVLAAIKARSEFAHISRAEALVRLSAIGRGSMDSFLELIQTPAGEEVRINLASAEAQENLHLIKSVTQQRYTMQTPDGPVEVVETGIELHCAMAAIEHILRLRGQYPAQKFDYTSNGKSIATVLDVARVAEQVAAEKVAVDLVTASNSAMQVVADETTTPAAQPTIASVAAA